MVHGVTAVMPLLGGSHRWALQIMAELFYAAPGSASLIGKVDFPATPVFGMQLAVPPDLFTDMTEAWQGFRIDRVVAVAQQINDGVA